jgi:hypothetical protein
MRRCLACVVQPDLAYIWGIYGNSISANGVICGLASGPSSGSVETSTEPGSPSTSAPATVTSDPPITQATTPPISTTPVSMSLAPATAATTTASVTSIVQNPSYIALIIGDYN